MNKEVFIKKKKEKKKCERTEVGLKVRKICQGSSLHFLETAGRQRKCLIKRLNSTVKIDFSFYFMIY